MTQIKGLMTNLRLFILFIFSVSWAQAQVVDFKGFVELTGIVSNSGDIPFWMYTNTNTALSDETHVSSTGDISATYSFKNSTIEAGAVLFFRDGVDLEFQRRDLFVKYQNNWLSATLGPKKWKTELEGLSVSNKNFLLSQNTRPLPGILFEANNPIKISETFGLDWGFGHYNLNDDRYLDDVYVMYKRLALKIKFNEKNRLTAKIQHFAQWAGTSPQYGDLPDDFNAFIDVFFARRSDEVGDINNELGNHLGTFLLDYEFNTGIGDFSTYHEHPFEDGSGSRWANFPDGIWGVFFQPKSQRIISAFLYEFIQTTDQSGTTENSGFDNYFSNNLYRSGWTYEGNVIGMPFITSDPDLVVTENNSAIINNRVQAHHFGFMGRFKNLDWRLKSSIVTSYGTYNHPIEPALTTWYNYLAIGHKTPRFGSLTIIGGVDFNSESKTLLAGGLTYNYAF